MAKEFEKAIDLIAKETKTYREANIMDGETLNKCLQQISATLAYLETIRADYHRQWQDIVYKQVLSGQSVARAENEAHVKVPEMYLLRRVMDGSYEVLNAIRSNISWLKTEKHHAV
mgnify:CR=1 FL=1